VSCTYTGEARSDATAALNWLAQTGPRDDPELAPLIAAIQYARASYDPWEQRCQKLSQTIPPLEKRVLVAFAGAAG